MDLHDELGSELLGQLVDESATAVNAADCDTDELTQLMNQLKPLQTLTDHIPAGIGVYYVYPDGRLECEYLNDGYYEMLGTTRKAREKYSGFSAYDAVHPIDKKRVKQELADAIAATRGIDMDIRMKKDDGIYKWLNMRSNIVEKASDKTTFYTVFSDIDERKKAQQEVENGRAMLDAAMNNANVMACKYNYKTETMTDSATFGIKYHLPKVIERVPEYILTNRIVADECRDLLKSEFERMSSEKLVEMVLKMVNTEGNGYLWNKIFCTPMFDEDGEYVESIVTFVDITEQKERELRYEEEMRLKKQVSNDTKVIAVLDLTDNRVAESDVNNPALADFYKLNSVDEVMQAVCDKYIHPADCQQYKEHFACKKILDNYEKGITHDCFRHQFVSTPGWYESAYDIVRNPITGHVEAVASMKNVTELVRSEQVVKQLMAIDYDSIITIDATTGEPHMFEQTDGSASGVIQEQRAVGDNVGGVESYLRKHCTDADFERVLKETSLPYVKERLNDTTVHTTLYSLNVDGKITRKRIIYTYLDKSKKTLLCAKQDVTEAYEQEEKQKEKLQEALKLAEQANASKTEFFSRMSHDMRTPMNGILGLTDLSKDETDIDVLKDNMNKIYESGRYLLGLINDTLDFQRIESGHLKLEPQVISTKEVVENVLMITRMTAEKKNVELRMVTQQADMESLINVDPLRIQQIFLNLISNAIKFTLPGGTVEICIACTKRTGSIAHDIITITDTGIGMSEEFLQNGIFKPFSQEHSSVVNNSAGSGLGLSIVKKLVELMGGRIEVESEIGVGSKFTVHIDFERMDGAKLQQQENQSEQRQTRVREVLKGKNVLLAEDHPLNAEIVKKLLAKMECNVEWAKDGKECVECFMDKEPGHYDMILMDIRMPNLDGNGAAQQIRNSDKSDAETIPIIAMTANAYEEDIQASKAAGMNAHLAKPVEPQVMYETMAESIVVPR